MRRESLAHNRTNIIRPWTARDGGVVFWNLSGWAKMAAFQYRYPSRLLPHVSALVWSLVRLRGCALNEAAHSAGVFVSPARNLSPLTVWANVATELSQLGQSHPSDVLRESEYQSALGHCVSTDCAVGCDDTDREQSLSRLSLLGRPPKVHLLIGLRNAAARRGSATTSALLPTPPFFCLFGWLARRGFPFLVWDAACRF